MADSSARYFLTLSASVVLPMQLTVHEPRPFTAELMRELLKQLTVLLRRFVRYEDVIVQSNGVKRARKQRMVSFVDVDETFRPGSMKEHREGALWFAYSLVRADEHNSVNSTHVLQPTRKASAGTWNALHVLPYLLAVVVAPSPRSFALLATSLANPARSTALVAASSASTSKFFAHPSTGASAAVTTVTTTASTTTSTVALVASANKKRRKK
jgi:hypothetical protein